MFTVKRKQQIGNLIPGLAVEVTCWLIGKEHFRAAIKCASQRHALLLAAGKLRREMVKAFAKPQLFQQCFGMVTALAGIFTA
jgi:hypothetical protein